MSGQKWLLAVGVRTYGGAGGGRADLPTAANDACLLYQTLTEDFGFEGVLLVEQHAIDPQGPYRTLRSRTAGEGTAEQIRNHLREMARLSGADDLFVLFFAGHAREDGTLMPYAAVDDRRSTHLTQWDLFHDLRMCQPARLVLLLGPRCELVRQTLERVPHGSAFVLSSGYDNFSDCEPVHNGAYSAFAAGLALTLTDLAPGQSLGPNEWAQAASRRYEGRNAIECRTNVAVLRTGGEAVRLRRPHIAMPPLPQVECRAGTPAKISRPLPQRDDLEWSLLDDWDRPIHDNPSSKSADVLGRKTHDGWSVTAKRPGFYALHVQAADGRGESARRLVKLAVQPAVQQSFAIEAPRQLICVAGKRFSRTIAVRGGVGELRVELEPALPPGLTCSIGFHKNEGTGIRIHGVAAGPSHAGRADSHSAQPIARQLWITATDANANVAVGHTRLLVISPEDYVRIEAGEFEIGYRSSDHGDQVVLEAVKGALGLIAQPNNARAQAKLLEIHKSFAAGEIAQVANANPASLVELGEFYIRKYPVTNIEWLQFVRAGDAAHRPADWDPGDPPFPPERATLPVTGIDYEAIQQYLAWRGTRLPTAWEWERAARGTKGALFPWGDQFDASKCNTAKGSIGHLTPVDRYDQHESLTGVRDLIGNAKEWVDRRVLRVVHRKASFYQVFRGGSHKDPLLEALTMRDSREAGIEWGADEDESLRRGTPLPYVGFRDVIDLDLDPKLPQDLVDIPDSTIIVARHEQHVAAFQMARYAVSNEEYWQFLQSDGYGCWPRGWVSPECPFPPAQRTLPVTGLSFRDALAFCLWKSRQTGLIVRLPTANQWRAAVAGGRNGVYPWGDRFDLQRCNGDQSGWGRRLPVHALPGGRSPQGVFNLVGNVAEQTCDRLWMGGGWKSPCDVIVEKNHGVDNGVGLRDQMFTDIGFRYIVKPFKGRS